MSWINFDLIPEEKPIVIHCSYRTGSTALCDYFATELGRVNFDEVYHPTLFKKRHLDYLDYRITSNKYVWKFMPDQIKSSNKDDILESFNKSFKVKLYRENVVDQITSWVISYKTNNWHIQQGEKLSGYEVKNIDSNWLTHHINRILENNRKVEELLPDSQADMQLKYEDIEHLIKSKYIKRPKPNNYVEVFDLVSKAMRSTK